MYDQGGEKYVALKQQARTLSWFGVLFRLAVIGLSVSAVGTGIYIFFLGPVWPWKIDPIKSWVEKLSGDKKSEVAGETQSPSHDSSDDTAASDDPQVPGTTPARRVLPPNAALADQIADLTDSVASKRTEIDAATRERDKFEKRIKSAESFMSTAQTQGERANAEYNSAVAAYNARVNSPVARGKPDALVRLQQDIDRAQRHQAEAIDNFNARKATLEKAQKTYDDAANKLNQLRAEMSKLRADLQKLQASGN
jgi:hypothetical protein